MFSLPRISAPIRRLSLQTAFRPSPSRAVFPSLSFPISQSLRGFAKATMSSDSATAGENYGMDKTSGHKQPVWIATEPYSCRPTFPKLDRNITTDVVVVGAGITGISAAYECVGRGMNTTLIDAREVLSGETGRTSGHLGSALDDRYYELIKTFGEDGARKAFDSHQYALERVGEVAAKEGIECEYRQLPGYVIVSVPDTEPSYAKKNDLPKEYEACRKLGIDVNYVEKGRVGEAYTGAILEFPKQATFHPTKYLNGLLKAMRKKYSGRFEAYSHTRMKNYDESGSIVFSEAKSEGVTVHTEDGHQIEAKNMIMATNVPLNIIEVIDKEAYYRTYCIAMRAPKDAYKDVLIYDNGDPYVYVKKTEHPDPKYEYIVTGGEDHKVGQESSEGYGKHYDNLAAWTKAHFPFVEDTEFAWSGQIVEPNDYMAYTGHQTGLSKHVYISTGDSGNGLTHGVIAGKLLTDLIEGVDNPWTALYDPSRKPKLRTVPEMIIENVNQNLNYSRYVKTDVSDIEQIPVCSGAVMHAGIEKLGKPVAVYKDGEGNVTEFSAVCPHLQGIVAWNATEQSWDCPVHGSRFDGPTGKCVMGPSNRGLNAENERAKKAQK